MDRRPFVYIIDKDEQAKDATVKLIEDQKFKVHAFSDAQRFFNFIQANTSPVHPAMVLVDVLSEGVSGFETVRRLTARYEQNLVPIIMTAKFESPEDYLEATNAGAITRLMKPFTFKNIVSVIEKDKARRLKIEQVTTVFLK